ncbi:MAG: hypothetical protein KGQ46_12410 [Hyphomicrobiales bacterium]|nr:hypothetical protein [Hyphomicrobiales bacterium]MDE2113837.1 hypothetical protein [Hyphomicrobiales bacterium]
MSGRLISVEEWRAHRAASLAIGPLDVGIDALLPYQQQVGEALEHHAVVVVEKSRRTGITWGAGSIAVLTSGAERQASGMDTFYIGYNLDMAREFIDTCAMWARAFDEAMTAGQLEEFLFDDGPDKSIQAFRIRFASGFEIVALASRPRSLRGRQGLVILDEAAFHDDLPGVLQAAMALLIWGGRVLIISTHDGEDNPFNGLIKEIRGGKKPYHLIRLDFDDALRAGLYQRICLVKGETWSVEKEAAWRAEIIAFYGDGADEELFCIPAESGGVFMPLPLIEARAGPVPVLRLTRPADWTYLPEDVRRRDIDAWCRAELDPLLGKLDPACRHYLGGDYARTRDLTVLWPLCVQRTLRRTTPFVVEMRAMPFDAQVQVQAHIIKGLPRFGYGCFDATGLGASMAEAAAQKFGPSRIGQIKLSSEWYRENMQPLKTAFEEAVISIAADADIVSDIALITVRHGVPVVPDARSGFKGDRHGDAAVALVLAYAASRATIILYEYETPGGSPANGRARVEAEDMPQGGRQLW